MAPYYFYYHYYYYSSRSCLKLSHQVCMVSLHHTSNSNVPSNNSFVPPKLAKTNFIPFGFKLGNLFKSGYLPYLASIAHIMFLFCHIIYKNVTKIKKKIKCFYAFHLYAKIRYCTWLFTNILPVNCRVLLIINYYNSIPIWIQLFEVNIFYTVTHCRAWEQY